MKKKIIWAIIFLVVIGAGITTYFIIKNRQSRVSADATRKSKSMIQRLTENARPAFYVPNEIIIKVKDENANKTMSSLPSLNALNQKYQAKIEPIKEDPEKDKTNEIILKGIYKLKINDSRVDFPLSEYKKDPNIDFAEPNYYYYPSTNFLDTLQNKENPNDPLFHSSNSWGQEIRDQWNLEKLNMSRTWALSKGNNVTVAVVDTGIDPDHEDLKDKITDPYDFVNIDPNQLPYGCKTIPGEDYTQPDKKMSDFAGHGTHVAGIIGATTNNSKGMAGIGWETKIMPVRAGFALECTDYLGTYRAGMLTELDIYKSIKYAARKGAKIINMSFSGSYSQLMDQAIKFAYRKNVLLIAAAGNEGSLINYKDWGNYSFPSSSPYVLTVGATDNNDVLTDYSNYGPKIDVVAPGGIYGDGTLGIPVLSCASSQGGFPAEQLIQGKYVVMAGTSMAAPHVAGTAALILSKNNSLNNEELRQLIRKGANDSNKSDLPGWDTYMGFGRINPSKSLEKTTNPPLAILNIPSKIKFMDFEREKTTIRGLIGGQNFDHYTLEYTTPEPESSPPKIPTDAVWKNEGVKLLSTNPDSQNDINAEIAEIELSYLDKGMQYNGSYIFKLTSFNKSGEKAEDFAMFSYIGAKSIINFPLSYEMNLSGLNNIYQADSTIINDKIFHLDLSLKQDEGNYYLALAKYPIKDKQETDYFKPEDYKEFKIEVNNEAPELKELVSNDIDNDGVKEIIAWINLVQDPMSGWAHRTEIFILETDTLTIKDGYPLEIKSTLANKFYGDKIVFGNFDKDNQKDIAILGITDYPWGTANSKLILITHTSSGKQEEKIILNKFASSVPFPDENLYDLAVGDLNKDNLDEIIVLATDSFYDDLNKCQAKIDYVIPFATIQTVNLKNKLGINESLGTLKNHVALADINNDQQLETILNIGKKVAVLNKDFNLLANWPKETLQGIDDLLIGNMNKDSNLEIILELTKFVPLDNGCRPKGCDILYDPKCKCPCGGYPCERTKYVDKIKIVNLEGQPITEKIEFNYYSFIKTIVAGDFNDQGYDQISFYHARDQQDFYMRYLGYNGVGEKIFERILPFSRAKNIFDGLFLPKEEGQDKKGKLLLQNTDSDNKIESIVSGEYSSVIFGEKGDTAGWPMERHDNCNSNNYNYQCN